MQYTSVGISLDYRYAIIHFNNTQRWAICGDSKFGSCAGYAGMNE